MLPIQEIKNPETAQLGWLWLRVFPVVVIKLLVKAAVIRRVEWDGRICFQDVSLTWLLMGELSSLLAVARRHQPLATWLFSQELCECPWNRAAGFPQASNSRDSKVEVPGSLMPWAMQSHILFPKYSICDTGQPYSIGKEQRSQYPELESLRRQSWLQQGDSNE